MPKAATVTMPAATACTRSALATALVAPASVASLVTRRASWFVANSRRSFLSMVHHLRKSRHSASALKKHQRRERQRQSAIDEVLPERRRVGVVLGHFSGESRKRRFLLGELFERGGVRDLLQRRRGVFVGQRLRERGEFID